MPAPIPKQSDLSPQLRMNIARYMTFAPDTSPAQKRTMLDLIVMMAFAEGAKWMAEQLKRELAP